MKKKYTKDILGTLLEVGAGTCLGRVDKASYTEGCMVGAR